MSGDPKADDDRERVIAFATSVLRDHVPDADGWCLGCLALWGRLAPHPCEQAKWATAVYAAYADPPD